MYLKNILIMRLNISICKISKYTSAKGNANTNKRIT